MPENEQTNETKPVGEVPSPVPEETKPLSLYDKTEAIVTRQEAANKKTEELLARQETLHANSRLAGTGGGNVDSEPAKETAKEYAERKMSGK